MGATTTTDYFNNINQASLINPKLTLPAEGRQGYADYIEILCDRLQQFKILWCAATEPLIANSDFIFMANVPQSIGIKTQALRMNNKYITTGASYYSMAAPLVDLDHFLIGVRDHLVANIQHAGDLITIGPQLLEEVVQIRASILKNIIALATTCKLIPPHRQSLSQ